MRDRRRRRPHPERASRVAGIDVAAGGWHTAAIVDRAGARTIVSWGSEVGETSNALEFRDVVLPEEGRAPHVVAPKLAGKPQMLVAGVLTTCALDDAANVGCWNGSSLASPMRTNTPTALGTGTARDNLVAELRGGATKTIASASGGAFAIAAGGGIAWVGAFSMSGPPSLPALNDAVLVAVGGSACAVRRDATVACWGANEKGQLGGGTKCVSSALVTVVAP